MEKFSLPMNEGFNIVNMSSISKLIDWFYAVSITIPSGLECNKLILKMYP